MKHFLPAVRITNVTWKYHLHQLSSRLSVGTSEPSAGHSSRQESEQFHHWSEGLPVRFPFLLNRISGARSCSTCCLLSFCCRSDNVGGHYVGRLRICQWRSSWNQQVTLGASGSTLAQIVSFWVSVSCRCGFLCDCGIACASCQLHQAQCLYEERVRPAVNEDIVFQVNAVFVILPILHHLFTGMAAIFGRGWKWFCGFQLVCVCVFTVFLTLETVCSAAWPLTCWTPCRRTATPPLPAPNVGPLVVLATE